MSSSRQPSRPSSYRSTSPHALAFREAARAAMRAPIGDGNAAPSSDDATRPARAPERETDPVQPLATEAVVVASQGDAPNGDDVEHVRQSRLSRWQEQR